MEKNWERSVKLFDDRLVFGDRPIYPIPSAKSWRHIYRNACLVNGSDYKRYGVPEFKPADKSVSTFVKSFFMCTNSTYHFALQFILVWMHLNY
jgi:hypothetical protein